MIEALVDKGIIDALAALPTVTLFIMAVIVIGRVIGVVLDKRLGIEKIKAEARAADAKAVNDQLSQLIQAAITTTANVDKLAGQIHAGFQGTVGAISTSADTVIDQVVRAGTNTIRAIETQQKEMEGRFIMKIDQISIAVVSLQDQLSSLQKEVELLKRSDEQNEALNRQILDQIVIMNNSIMNLTIKISRSKKSFAESVDMETGEDVGIPGV